MNSGSNHFGTSVLRKNSESKCFRCSVYAEIHLRTEMPCIPRIKVVSVDMFPASTLNSIVFVIGSEKSLASSVSSASALCDRRRVGNVGSGVGSSYVFEVSVEPECFQGHRETERDTEFVDMRSMIEFEFFGNCLHSMRSGVS